MDDKNEYMFTELPITHDQKEYIDLVYSRQTGKPQSHQYIKDDQILAHLNQSEIERLENIGKVILEARKEFKRNALVSYDIETDPMFIKYSNGEISEDKTVNPETVRIMGSDKRLQGYVDIPMYVKYAPNEAEQMQEHYNWINKNINTDDVRKILTNPERGESITMLEIPEENFLLKTNIVSGYTSDDKPYEVEIGDAGNIENFTDEQVPIIVNMLNILENQGIESLWSKLTPEMYELAMNHSILAYELEEFYLEGNNKYDIVINDDLNRTHGLMISVFGRDFE